MNQRLTSDLGIELKRMIEERDKINREIESANILLGRLNAIPTPVVADKPKPSLAPRNGTERRPTGFWTNFFADLKAKYPTYDRAQLWEAAQKDPRITEADRKAFDMAYARWWHK